MIDTISLQGTRHALAGMANQDACAWAYQKDRLIFAVCDGVSLDLMGRSSHSELASEYCARAFVEFVKKDPEAPLNRVFERTANGLMEFLKEKDISWFDCQTTLIGGVYDKGVLSVGMAGDGGLIVEKENGQLSVLVTKAKTSSVVEPICFPDGWRFAQVDGAKAFLAATDGVFDGLAGQGEDGFVFNVELINAFFTVPQAGEDHEGLLKALCSLIESGDDQTVLVFDSTVASRAGL